MGHEHTVYKDKDKDRESDWGGGFYFDKGFFFFNLFFFSFFWALY